MDKLTLDDVENLPISIKYAGESPCLWGGVTPGGKNALVDRWIVTLESRAGFYQIDYYTGRGLRKNGKPIKPKKADVFHSLMLDAEAANMNFSEWCDTFGYSDDSIHAIGVYKQCLEHAAALKKHLGRDVCAQLAELLQDY